MENPMRNFKRTLVLFILMLSLIFGVVTTAYAADGTDAPADDTTGETTPPNTDGAEDNGDETLADALARLESKTPLSQYDLPVLNGPYVWEPGTTEAVNPKWSGTTGTAEWGQILGRAYGVNDIGIEEVEPGNSAFTIRYNGQLEREYQAENGGELHTYAYFSINSDRTKQNNLVMEFDIACFGDKYPAMAIEHSTVPAKDGSGTKLQPKILDIKANGSIRVGYNGASSESGHSISDEEQARVDAVRLGFGEWTHVSLIYESETCFVSLYVDYEFIARWDTRPKNVAYYDLLIFRFGTSNPGFIDGEVSIDNFIAYEGSYVRTTDLFENMLDPERAIFYADYITNETATSMDRVASYRYLNALLDNFYVDGEFIPYEDDDMDPDSLAALNAELEAAIAKYQAFVTDTENGYAKLYNDYITANLESFKAMVNAFPAERTLANLDARAEALSAIDKFVASCGEDMLRSEDSDYVTVKNNYDKIVRAIENDRNIHAFCNYVDTFYRAADFGIETLTKHYNNAVTAYEAITEKGVRDTEGFERFAESYLLYVQAKDVLDEKIYANNSKTIVECIGFISGYTTVQQWNENYEYINKYVVIVRGVVKDGKYNIAAPGVPEAIEFFNSVDGYFYDLLQKEHAAYIEGMLEKYRAAESYVEKKGICDHLDDYIASVDIDVEHSAVKPSVQTFGFYKEELKDYINDYNELLKQNTLIFKNTIALMSVADGYRELLALYETARELYFAMNVGDESIKEELAYYDELTFYLEAVELASEEFLKTVEALRAAEGEEKFAALVHCYIAARDAEMEYDGVAEAMEYYLAEYEAYNSEVERTVDEIGSTVSVSVGSVRVAGGVREIVAVIVKKITGEA